MIKFIQNFMEQFSAFIEDEKLLNSTVMKNLIICNAQDDEIFSPWEKFSFLFFIFTFFELIIHIK